MSYRAGLFAILFAAVSAVHAQPPTGHNEVELAVRQYLSMKYDESEDLGPERRAIYGVAYNPAAPLKPLDIPELAVAVPYTQYFTTTLDTPFSCYSKLEVIVVATKTSTGFVMRSSVSPVYTEPSRKLLSVVRGKVGSTDEDRKQLATGVGKLLASITYDGQLKNLHTSGQIASVELWHGELHWLNIELLFDAENKVESVYVESTTPDNEEQITR